MFNSVPSNPVIVFYPLTKTFENIVEKGEKYSFTLAHMHLDLFCRQHIHDFNIRSAGQEIISNFLLDLTFTKQSCDSSFFIYLEEFKDNCKWNKGDNACDKHFLLV